jgi:hypothetical protein
VFGVRRSVSGIVLVLVLVVVLVLGGFGVRCSELRIPHFAFPPPPIRNPKSAIRNSRSVP